MPDLEIAPLKQARETSCWAACSRMFLAHFGAHYTSDDHIGIKVGLPTDKCQDMSKVLTSLGIFDATDDEDLLAPFAEIKSEIDKGNPVVQAVTETKIKKGADSADGHYVLIIGYDEAGKTITVIEPSDASVKTVKYSSDSVLVAGVPMYFAQPYYVARPVAR